MTVLVIKILKSLFVKYIKVLTCASNAKRTFTTLKENAYQSECLLSRTVFFKLKEIFAFNAMKVTLSVSIKKLAL